MHGEGTEIWEEGRMKYTGHYQFGQKTGRGVFEFDGHSYEGDFVLGQFHGHGKYTIPDKGRVLEGIFKDN